MQRHTNNIYVRQLKGYGIGNFINLTPAIQMLSKHLNKPIPVLFQQPEIEELFEGCYFIEPIKKPLKKLVLCSSHINQVKQDWLFNAEKIKKQFNIEGDIPHTFVPKHNNFGELNHVVIVRGMVNDSWANKKDPGDHIYKKIIQFLEQHHQIVFIGSTADFQRTHNRMIEWCEHTPIIIRDDIKTSSSAIQKARFIVSNDTGMYHVASALNKKQFVMWKDTNFVKNKAPGQNNHFSFIDEWAKDFEEFYKQINN